MRMPWRKSNANQLDLLGGAPTVDASAVAAPTPQARPSAAAPSGQPLLLSVSLIDEDPANPRTEFPEADLDELADDIQQRGILQPLVLHPADADGRHRLHFGAKRLRAARRAGLHEVPVVIRDERADPYAQVAENQKRHGLSPLDLARFIRGRVHAGESNALIAKRLGMNLTTVAHHLSLLDLPPILNKAFETGRCMSPRTLHELNKLHQQRPDQVQALVSGWGEITREAVASLRVESVVASRSVDPIAQANAACDRLEKVLARIEPTADQAGLQALRLRLRALSNGRPWGSGRQTPEADSH
jgi:ParB family chromosome partitioning protein